MKFECSYEKFFSVISRIEKVTGKHPTLPVLSCILCTATSDGRVVFRATNLHVGAEFSLIAKVESPGTCALPGSYIAQALGGMNGQESVVCELIGDIFHLSAKKSKTKLKTLAYDDFPELPKKPGTIEEISITTGELSLGIKSVMFAGSGSDIKPELSSIYIYGKGSELIFVATDAFRLAEKKISFNKAENINPFLIPIKNAQDILKIIPDSDESITLSISEHQLYLTSQNIFITTQLTHGNFPDYTKIIPNGVTTNVILLKNDLIQVLKTIPLFSNHYHHINLSVNPTEKSIIFHAENAAVGEINSSLDAVIEGDAIDVGLNARYIQEVLGIIQSDSLFLQWLDPRKPLVIRGQHDPSFLYLVMPMNRS